MRETFFSPFGQKTKEAAQRILTEIRAAHPESSGWKEISAGVELRDDGWHAYPEHEHN